MNDGVLQPQNRMGNGPCVGSPRCYNVGMRFAPGRVVGGRVEFVGDLPEGAPVAVLAIESDGTFEADRQTEEMLLRAIAECDEGRTTPLANILSELRDRE